MHTEIKFKLKKFIEMGGRGGWVTPSLYTHKVSLTCTKSPQIPDTGKEQYLLKLQTTKSEQWVINSLTPMSGQDRISL